jgi:paraquat-inducible protein B
MKVITPDKVKSFKSKWYLLLFPLAALVITAMLFYKYNFEKGPRIRISFEDASSIQVEKTRVRYRGVAVGVVKEINFSENQNVVIAEILLRKDAEHFAVEGSKFSLVSPKVNFQGVSGLDTLVEGSYIEVLPGPATSEAKFDFKAMLSSSSTEPLNGTSAFIIETSNAESISEGDAVTFRGVKVGSLTKLNFAKGAQMVHLQINLENRFAYLVRENTVFWSKVGIQADLGLFGSDIKVNSMDSIMNGGVEFATPTVGGPRAKNFHKFTLAKAAPKTVLEWKPFLD